MESVENVNERIEQIEIRNGVKALRRGLAIALLLALSFATDQAHAQTEQLYLLGVTAARGSISADEATTDVVHLRWDTVEGALPSDVTQIRLVRDPGGGGETELLNVANPGVMNAGQILALYAEDGQERRKLETIRWLDGYLPTTVDASNFHTRINELIDTQQTSTYDHFWSVFASRNDINIARARHRGFIDVGAPAGMQTYALYASNGISEIRVGEVVVDVGTRKPMPAAVNFATAPLGRCDAPEEGKDHGAIALVWDHPGSTLTDRFGAALTITGYDLYREDVTTCEGCGIPNHDIAALAAGINHHPVDGTVAIPNLVKVNDQPIAIAATPASQQQYQGYNDPYYHVLITAPQVAEMGFKPGDIVGFYLVARDYTGNYGATVSAEITIPNNIRPPAPWNISTQAKTFVDTSDPTDAEQMRIVWDHVDVVNYHNDHKLDRTYCNLETARFDKELRYVPEGGECEIDPQVAVELDVEKYLVYRFESQEDARKFHDTDGDGYSDADERVDLGGGLSLPRNTSGTTDACDPNVTPANPLLSRLVGEVNINTSPDQQQRPSGRVVMQYLDETVPQNPDTIYWYRVAAYSSRGGVLPGGGKLSELSAPVRALYHDRNLPQRDDCLDIDLVTNDVCSYDFVLGPEEPVGNPVTARDDTADGVAEYVTLSCTVLSSGAFISETQVFTGSPGNRTATLTGQQCENLTPCIGQPAFAIGVYDANDIQLGGALYSGGVSCPYGTAVLSDVCTERTVRPGETLAAPPRLENTCADNDLCTSIYQEIGDKSYKLATHCLPDPPPTLTFPGMSGEVCLSYALHDENNNLSAKTYFPCFHLSSLTAPDAPQLVGFSFDVGTEDGHMTFVPPEQPIAGTLLEWGLAGDPNVTTVFHAHEGHTASDGELVEDVVLPTPAPIGEEQEEWCFRGRSVTRDGDISAWSPRRCDIRLPAGVTYPVYMPWPKIDIPGPAGTDTEATYLAADGRIVIRMGDPITTFNACEYYDYGTCTGEASGGDCFLGPDAIFFTDECSDFCTDIQASRTEPLGFVAYRQWGSVADDPNASEFQQVSPLVEFVHCNPYEAGGIDYQTLADPFFLLAEFASPHPWAATGPQMVFLDRAPHIQQRWYRYQFVYFNARGEITNYRNSNWVQAQ